MRSWNELTLEEQDEFINSDECNGCWWKGGWIKPPYHKFFEASCNAHDWGYYQWWTEYDRMKVDKGFLKYMKQDCDRIGNIFLRIFYKTRAYIYYYFVRKFWHKYFNYIKV